MIRIYWHSGCFIKPIVHLQNMVDWFNRHNCILSALSWNECVTNECKMCNTSHVYLVCQNETFNKLPNCLYCLLYFNFLGGYQWKKNTLYDKFNKCYTFTTINSAQGNWQRGRWLPGKVNCQLGKLAAEHLRIINIYFMKPEDFGLPNFSLG